MAYNQKEKRDMIFHGALVQSSPVRVTVDGEPKYLKGKNNDIIELTIDNNKVTYWCENERCAKFFAGQKGKTFSIVAKGGGKDPEAKAGATIEFAGESRPAETSAPAQNGPSRQAQPTTRGTIEPEKAVGSAKVYIARRVSLLKICTRAALSYAKEVAADKENPLALGTEQTEKVIVSLFISAERAGYADHMPVAINYHDLSVVASKHGGNKASEPAKPVHHCPQCGDAVVEKVGDICADCKEIQAQAQGEEETVPF